MTTAIAPESSAAKRRFFTASRDDLRRWFLAILCGICMSLAAPTLDCWPLSLVGWVSLIVACDGQRPWRSFRLAWLAGFVAVAWAYFWMGDLLTNFGHLPYSLALVAHGLFSLWSGLAWAWPFAIASWFAARWHGAWLIALPLAWWGTELVWPELFSVYIAFFWSWYPPAIQLADLGGAGLVSALMLAINGALGMAVLAGLKKDVRPAIHYTGLAIAMIAANWGYGLWRIAALEDEFAQAQQLKVGLVQGNFGINARKRARETALTELQRVSHELEKQGAQLLVWGETSYPYAAFTRASTHDFDERDPRRVRRDFAAPLLIGTVTTDPIERSFRKPWNTAWVLNSDGSLGDRYDKYWPLWFGEYAPLVDPTWYLEQFPNASQMQRGEGPGILRVGDIRLGPLICYEDLLAPFAAHTVDLGVQALVNMTNDSWFGRARAQHEHFALALLRAVETRRSLVRAVNAGPSAVVWPTGEIVAQSELTDADTDGFGPGAATGLVATIPLADPESKTLYVRIHQLLIPLVWGSLVALAVWVYRRRARA